MRQGVDLGARLKEPRILVAPGAADALTARLIEEAGFEAVYVTGAGIANTQFAVADLGLPTLTELAVQVQRMADAVSVPLIVDADTGFGGPLNIQRTVRELERAGASAIQIEDQVSPKRCGHFEGKSVVSVDEMLGRLRAALDARTSPSTLIVARTDARATEGLQAAIERSQAYAEAGADVIFVEAPTSVEEFRLAAQGINAPLLANMVEGGKSPSLSAAELEALGYRVVIFANTALRVAVLAVQQAMRELREHGTTQGLLPRMVDWQERQRLVRLAELQAIEGLYSQPSG